jgi:hypothetical protein
MEREESHCREENMECSDKKRMARSIGKAKEAQKQ